MTTFIIKYYRDRGGNHIEEVTPDMAHIFRVFQYAGIGLDKKWVHDFTRLSLANEFIEKIRTAEINLHDAFRTFIRQGQEPNALKTLIGNVLENIKLEMTRGDR
jgi:hypothetical protein